ncbi:hypothetical protein ACF3NG_04875 [Aerococcaceae bacterium WGS1372]
MNKNTLRSLGIGFLSAGILSAAFAIFVQGQSPVEGIKVNSLLNNSNAAQVSQYEEQISSLQAERDSMSESLSATSNQDESALQESISSLTEANESLKAQLSDRNTDTASSADNNDESESNEDTTEASTVESGEVAQAQPDVEGSFTINSGETSSEIADRLEAEGYISSATEFQSLLDEWDLNSVIQAGDFDINSDMSIHDIVSIITEGAYYYY